MFVWMVCSHNSCRAAWYWKKCTLWFFSYPCDIRMLQCGKLTRIKQTNNLNSIVTNARVQQSCCTPAMLLTINLLSFPECYRYVFSVFENYSCLGCKILENPAMATILLNIVITILAAIYIYFLLYSLSYLYFHDPVTLSILSNVTSVQCEHLVSESPPG